VLFWSAVVIMAGHISLALLPGISGVIAGLLFVALGSGGLKANATRIVGTLYDEHDSRRDAGFSIFYLGLNLGAFFGPLLTGLLPYCSSPVSSGPKKPPSSMPRQKIEKPAARRAACPPSRAPTSRLPLALTPPLP